MVFLSSNVISNEIFFVSSFCFSDIYILDRLKRSNCKISHIPDDVIFAWRYLELTRENSTKEKFIIGLFFWAHQLKYVYELIFWTTHRPVFP